MSIIWKKEGNKRLIKYAGLLQNSIKDTAKIITSTAR